MNTKRTLTLSLCLIIATISSLSAQAVGDQFKAGQLYYQITSLSPKEVAVVPQYTRYPYWDNDQKPTGELTIPATITHNDISYSVTNIGNEAFWNCRELTNITIPNSVTNIGKGAFYQCTGLTNITIPNSVTNIGDLAFTGCSGLTNITIPNSVTNIGDRVFTGCSGLTAINIDSQNANYTDIEGVLFNKNKTTLIAYPNAKKTTSYTIPNSVTNIGDRAFYQCTGLTNITIPNSVTNIGKFAFLGCTGLTNVTIPNSVTIIGEETFAGCTGLTAIHVDAQNPNYTDIEGVLFNKNKTTLISYPNAKATSYTIPNSVKNIERGAFYQCTELTNVTIPNSVTNIENWAFQDCTGLTNITIPSSITNIGEGVFYGCTGLTNIAIPNSVTNIGNSVFSGCTGLTSITIPNSVTNIGDYGFSGCTGLTSITIPNSVTNIGDRAFRNCKSLTEITIPNSVTNIGNEAFSFCTEMTNVTISNSVTNIGHYAFYQCTGLTSITIPNSVTNIGDGVFANCTGLTSITSEIADLSKLTTGLFLFHNVNKNNCILYVPQGKITNYQAAEQWKEFTKIAETGTLSVGHKFKVGQLYYQITSLSPNKVAVVSQNTNYPYWNETEKPTGEISIPATITHNETSYSVTDIGESAFNDCTGLTNITIPNSVTNIGGWAFSGCTGLTNITIPSSVTNIGDWAFQSCLGLSSIIIPNSVTNIGEGAFAGCIRMTDINVDSQNTSYTDIEGVLFNKNKTTLIACPNAKSGTYTIPNSVTSIGNFAFWNCDGLTSITIPNSVTNIGNEAFSFCERLTNVIIPNSVTNIGEGAFNGCIRMTSINVDNQNANYTDIEGVLFNKNKTTLIACPNAKSGTYTIPNSVTKIGNYAFQYCRGITSITIPNSVTSIGKGAFWNCRELTNITIPNSVTNIENWAFVNCTGLTNITIPNSVTNIGNQAFSGCTGLTSITSEIANLSQLTIGWHLFLEVDKGNCILYVPQGKVADYQAAEQWKEFTNIKEIEGSGISQVDAERYIALSPNPAREKVTISIAPALVEQVSSLTLLDSNGKTLKRQAITGSETIIDLTSYTSGIYFVQIDNVVKKLIIK